MFQFHLLEPHEIERQRRVPERVGQQLLVRGDAIVEGFSELRQIARDDRVPAIAAALTERADELTWTTAR